MKKLISMLVLVLLAGVSQLSYAAGGPLDEDLSTLEPVAKKAIEAGNQGDAQTFLNETNELYRQTQGHPDSASRQRIITKLRKALKHGESGNLKEAVKAVEDALPNMKHNTDGLKFGGGT
ncbi:MAG: small metal-binding protein SmbP [Gammaproteobacteria bacterium]